SRIMFIVLVALAVSLLVVFAIFTLMFCDVAFGPAQTAMAAGGVATGWGSPRTVGQKLADWASNATQTRGQALAYELARELPHEAQTATVVANHDQTIGCPSYSRSAIAVTAPEAIRTADFLQRFHPEAIPTVRAQALENLRQTRGMTPEQYRAAAPRCPLLGPDNSCLTYSVRPLSCRGGCDLSKSSTCGMGTDGASATTRATPAAPVADPDFREALHSAGLDGELYDLNGALVTALETPHAAERWIRGEPVFSNCRRYE
ncbi:MAG: hypothetical protein JSS02_06975, partial [Planctomycetes bacterium]|nr:hypothetical protein [Planctomycetota bacterium]